MAATSVTAFSSSIGVNTHLDSPNTSYSNTSLVISEVAYLGLLNLRDVMASPADPALFAQVASATGALFNVHLGSGQPYGAQINLIVKNLSFIRFAEGINEPDTFPQSYNGLTGFAAVNAAQQDLYTAVKAAGNTPVIAPSYGILSSYSSAPDNSANSDYGNIHEYFGTGNPPAGSLPSLLATAGLTVGNAPILATEAGFYTGEILSSNSQQFAASVVDETVQAKYDLTILFDNWNLGVNVTYFYELMDRVVDTGNTDYRFHYGLFNADGSPKLAAVAIHNLTTILSDTGTPRSGGLLPYQTTGWPSTGNSLLLEKSSGVFDLALWNDIRLWSAVSPGEINNPLPQITVNFGQIVQSVVVYDPMVGTSPIATWSNVTSFSVGLPDHPVIFEITLHAPGQLSLDSYVLPASLSAGQSSGNLWSQIMGNVVESNPNWLAGVTINSVQTNGTTGSVTFDATNQILTYLAPSYNPFNPTDSFTYTVTDGQGGSATGTIAVTELPAPLTIYAMTVGATYTAPAAGWTMISLATGQTLNGNAGGGGSFLVNIDTQIHAAGNNNSIQGGAGNFYAGAGGDNARISLGDGNNIISVTGLGATITTGNGNNVVWKPTGFATIVMGDGNQKITAGGSNNTVSIGSGVSSISLGTDGSAAGYESITVAGGTNTIYVGGANDTVHILGGTNNSVGSTGGLATIVVDGGSNTLNIKGAANTLILNAGTNVANTNGAGNIIQGGSGTDTIWAGGNNNSVVAGSGTESITFAGSGNVADLTMGTDTFIENGSGNTIILAAAGGIAAQIKGNVIAVGDIFDLRVALAATNWSGYLSDLPNYLLVRNSGATSIISIDADGSAAGVVRDIAVLNSSANLTYGALLSSAILPPTKAHQLELTQSVMGISLPGNGTSGNLWSMLMSNAVEANSNWAAEVTVSSVQTSGMTGAVAFNAATKSLVYVAPAYNAFNPNDSFSYTVSDGHGGNATGSIAITELPAPKTVYAMTASTSYTAPATGWTMISLAAGQTFNGISAGGVSFIASTDTKIYAGGSNNTIQGGAGNFYAGAGVNNARITLGDGNNIISVSGVGAVITTGNGNNTVWKPTGYSTITMGNGNQKITVGGVGNTVTVGSGTSTLNIGNDGATAGYETITVGGGTNTISTGGANNIIRVLGGVNNTISSSGGQATVTVEGGSNSLSIQGSGNIVRLNGGVNTFGTSGNGNTIQGGSGNDRIWAGGNYNLIIAGSGVETITFSGQHNTIDVTKGATTLIENGSANTFILAGLNSVATQISGNIVSRGDTLDLRAALATTNWAGSMADLPNYLAVRSSGAASIISIDQDGATGKAGHDMAVLNNSGNLTYSGLLAVSLVH